MKSSHILATSLITALALFPGCDEDPITFPTVDISFTDGDSSIGDDADATTGETADDIKVTPDVDARGDADSGSETADGDAADGELGPDIPEITTTCGDSVCEVGESCVSCPGDCPVCVPAPGEVIFTEIMQNPLAVGDPVGEWFELTNLADHAFDLAGLTLGDDDFELHTIDPDGGVLEIAPGQHLIFGLTKDLGVGVAADYVYSGIGLANGVDTLVLKAGDTVIDEVSWDGGATFPDPVGASMSLGSEFQDALANDAGASWCVGLTVYGTGDRGTPGAANPSCAPPAASKLVINEVAAGNAGEGTWWVEIAEVGGGTAAVLDGWTLSDGGEGVWTAIGGTNLPANAYLVVDKASLGFALGGSGTLTLKDAAGAVVDTASWLVGEAPAGTSWGRIPNGTGPFMTLGTPTPGAANISGAPAACGDGTCNGSETCTDCPGDCGACPASCGDGTCDSDEGCKNCAADCGACPVVCGDGTCDASETCLGCASDCGTCPVVCGDGTCDASETCSGCPGDCGECPVLCGDGACHETETCTDCAADCGACPVVCGDGTCEGDEACDTCEDDCGSCAPVCGDGVCAGDETCGSCGSDCGDCPVDGCATVIFISEYIEGASNDKALELTNNTGKTVDLADYAFWRISNGGDWAEGEGNAYALSGTLAHGASFVLCHSKIQGIALPNCDSVVGSGISAFNGDDAIGLAYKDILIDTVGDAGEDPGAGWDVAGIGSATRDHTLRRKSWVGAGTTDWIGASASQWLVLDKGTLDGLGSHDVATGCTAAALVCGDGACDIEESCSDCAADCGECAPECGDGTCNGAETCTTCEGDCGVCGPACGDGTCNGAETCVSCETDCGACAPTCGDGTCNGAETCTTCEADCGACGPVCGDGTCEGAETCSDCTSDCGACPTGTCGSSLFFSEVIDGSGYDNAVEIMNATGFDFDLSTVAIWKISNTGDWTEGEANAFALTGSLAHGSTYVICNNKIDELLVGDCDIVTNKTVLAFNGNDALGLAVSGVLVDVFGQPETADIDGWDVAGIEEATKFHTLRRKGVYFEGNTDWASSAANEWTVLDGDTFGGLASHSVDAFCEVGGFCGDGTCDAAEDCEGCETDCGPCDPVGPANCCAAHGDTPGCDLLSCESIVCDFDDYCCEFGWDVTCVEYANDFCPACSTGCGTDCCFESPSGEPECELFDCTEAVCDIDAFCCTTDWDSVCAGYAEDSCASCAVDCEDYSD